MIHASVSARSGPWARVASRRIVPSGSITSTQAASATAGTSSSSSRRSASSMSAAPSVMRAASASSSSWRRSVSALPRARIAASRWRAANTASAAPAATVTSGTAALSPNDPCQTGLISERKKASTPTSPTSRERAPSAIPSTGSRYQVRPKELSPVAMSTAARATSATSPPTSQGTVRRSTAAVYADALGSGGRVADQHPGPAGRLRAPARAAAAAHRRRRPGRPRGARRRAREALDQEGVEGRRAAAVGADDRPDDARGRRHAGQGPRPVGEGDPAGSRRPVDPELRRGLRVPEPRADGARRRRAAAASRSPASRPRSRPASRRWRSRSTTSRRPSRPAPTRSTW